jgi:DNA-binding CsgD family transcriptional regulator
MRAEVHRKQRNKARRSRQAAGLMFWLTRNTLANRICSSRPPAEAVADEFNLTLAEVRVMFAIVEIGGVPEVAPVLGISEQTVKTHLHRIYEKTATKRQADLVKLVASYSARL